MSETVFVEIKFWLLVIFSIGVPFIIYWVILAKRSISTITTLLLGFSFIVIAGLDVYLLQTLSAIAKATPSLADDAIFHSEITLALYLLPAMCAGIGVNVVSNVLVATLTAAEKNFRDKHTDS
ncbi:hypothetical protein BH11PSE11_BH11PSE11_03520 [soil metagenome]